MGGGAGSDDQRSVHRRDCAEDDILGPHTLGMDPEFPRGGGMLLVSSRIQRLLLMIYQIVWTRAGNVAGFKTTYRSEASGVWIFVELMMPPQPFAAAAARRGLER